VQLPLPKGADEARVLQAVRPDKDADGFHPINLGKLLAGNPDGTFVAPCTPWGVMQSLRHLGIDPAGKHAVVVGRSIIVGKPMALLLLHANATVTLCHSKTADLAGICRQADILVAAVGRPWLIRRDSVKDGAVVIDVGVNRVGPEFFTPEVLAHYPEHAAALAKRGSALAGDVAYHEVLPKAWGVTPVPGGVGPLTIAMLLENTIALARKAAGV